jgi:hypothetical protein
MSVDRFQAKLPRTAGAGIVLREGQRIELLPRKAKGRLIGELDVTTIPLVCRGSKRSSTLPGDRGEPCA